MAENRVLGQSGIQVSSVGLGCMGFSHAYGEPTEKGQAVRMIRGAYEMGYTFFDTAECYTGINPDGSTSYNEELVDYRSRMPQYTEEGFAAAEKLMQFLAELGTEKQASSGQLSLAWMLCKKPWIIPIPGSRKEARILENLRSQDVVLSEEEIRRIDALLDTMDMPAYGRRS